MLETATHIEVLKELTIKGQFEELVEVYCTAGFGRVTARDDDWQAVDRE